MGIKAVFTDMDGTLLKDNFLTSEENIAAIKRAIAKGIKVVPTTGRALGDIPDQILSIPGLEYLVLANGALVYDVKKREFIFNDHMDKRKVLKLLTAAPMQDVCFFAMINGYSHYQKSIFERIKGTNVYDVLVEFLDYNVILDDDLIETIRLDESNVEKIVLYFRNSSHIFNVVNSMPILLDFDCANSLGYNIEITKKGVNKALGVNFLCKRLKLTPDEIVTIGDSGNDEKMLKMTPNSYAVKNAMRSAKRAAKFEAPANTENAVAFVINKYLDEV